MDKQRGRPRAIEAKQQYTVMLKASIVKEIDEFAEELEMTRSQLLSNLIETGLDDLKSFNSWGVLWVVKAGREAIGKLKEGKLGLPGKRGKKTV